MRRIRKISTVFAALCLLAVFGAGRAGAEALAPFKDGLFKYKKITASHMNGDFIVVEYSKQRDLRDRDKVDEREVFGNYVS